MKIAPRPRVIIRRCSTYDTGKIRTIIREGLEELDLRPSGRTLVKPNVVASGPTFPHAYTRPEFVEGVLRALQDRGGGRMTELAVGERCGITVPTRTAFDGAGYYPMLKRTGAKVYHFEEERQVEIRLTHKERLRDYLFTPEPVARADFFVNCPKFKSHPWTTVTFSMKNYIGIQDDRHRLIDHDHRLNEKVADLQYIVQPQFIAIDGITAGEGRMLTPIPVDLGLIIMGNSQVAFDAVCCHIIGVDPMSVEHIRLAAERGFGTTDLGSVELSGDVTLEEAKAKAKGFQVGLVRVEKYFEGTNITAYAGAPPERERTDYCWGGCPGAIEEAIEILRIYDKQCDAKMPRLHVVFGAYEGPIDAKPGEKVVFIGDCARWKGNINGELVSIESLYKDRTSKDPYKAKHDDIYAKMVTVGSKLAMAKDDGYVRLEGCPVSVAEQVLALVSLGNTKNPYFSPLEVVKFNRGYLGWRGTTLAKRIAGHPYQVHGPCHRGEAAPEVTAPGETPPTPAAE
ncbi:MAG TPA: DUF362 domain-containing protein [Polyangiaceae bacterium]|jgi:uncharacterized protein (DUF362 family)|nr:DUF362 domain-containing protein [Polyangiaceae bacterium]